MKIGKDAYQNILGKELPHIQDTHAQLIRRFMGNYPGKPLNQREMAEYLNIDEARLSNLISPSKRDENFGKYGKILQGRDVIRCLLKGVYNVKDLGLNLNDRDEALLEKFGTLVQNPDLLSLIYEALELDLDVRSLISPAVEAIKSKIKAPNE